MKVKCIYVSPEYSDKFTVGKIYEYDGNRIIDDKGCISCNWYPIADSKTTFGDNFARFEKEEEKKVFTKADLKDGDKIHLNDGRKILHFNISDDFTVPYLGATITKVMRSGTLVYDREAEEKKIPHMELDGDDYGTLGTPTSFKDVLDKPLNVGDTVDLYCNGNYHGERAVVQPGKDLMRTDKQFVMGIEGLCDNETGKIGGGFKILKKRNHTEVKNGEIVGIIKYIK